MEVATLVEGNFFGEINLLTGWLATATVTSFFRSRWYCWNGLIYTESFRGILNLVGG